jgi:hypothetical protein
LFTGTVPPQPKNLVQLALALRHIDQIRAFFAIRPPAFNSIPGAKGVQANVIVPVLVDEQPLGLPVTAPSAREA